MDFSKDANIILSPHFDDAVFSLGGFLGKYPNQTKVVTIFGGTPSKPVSKYWDRVCGFKNSTIAVEKRVGENAEALKMLGVPSENIINLSYPDRQYRKTFSNEEKSALLSDIKAAISHIPEGRINIFSPMLGYHRDHAITTDAVTEFFKEISADKKRIHHYLYQDMPYFYLYYTKRRILNFFKSKTRVILSLSPKQNSSQEIIGMSTQEFEQKIAAEKVYASQFRAKYFGFRSLPKKQHFFGSLQSKIFKIKEPECEVVYEIR